MPRFADREQPCPAALVGAKWIGASRDTLRDCRHLPRCSFLQVFPLTLSLKLAGDRQVGSGKQGWREMEQDKGTGGDQLFAYFGHPDEQGNVNQFFHQRGSMVAAAVFQELFAVIRGESQDAIFPEFEPAQGLNQSRNLSIYPTYSRVVHRDNFVPIRSQTFTSNVKAVPVRVQIARAGRRKPVVLSEDLQAFFRGIVRRMRIHKVKPEEEGILSDRGQPGARLLDDYIRRRKPAQHIERSRSRGTPSLAVSKVEFVIGCAHPWNLMADACQSAVHAPCPPVHWCPILMR